MPIPAFTIDGVLPPYVGPLGPGDLPEAMTPYTATAVEIVAAFGTSDLRRTLLQNWLDHRAAVRALGFVEGFQWIDGSFVEDKVPRDIDVVTFTRRPARAAGAMALDRLMRANPELFVRADAKRRYNLDTFFLDLDGSKEVLVNYTRYLTGLFSHRRGDDLWKGMVQVRLEDAADEAAANAALAALSTPAGAGP